MVQKRNQRQYSSQVMSQIENELRSQHYNEEKEAELQLNKKMRALLEKFFIEEFEHEQAVLCVGMDKFNAWHSYQVKRNFSLAAKELKQTLSTSFSYEIVDRYERVLNRVHKEIEEENRRIKKQMEREAFKNQFLQLRAKSKIG